LVQHQLTKRTYTAIGQKLGIARIWWRNGLHGHSQRTDYPYTDTGRDHPQDRLPQVTCLGYSAVRYKNSNTKLLDTKSNKLALFNSEHTSKTRTMQQQTSKFQLKSKFTQLKSLNSSERSINAYTHSQHNENATKNHQLTDNQYSRQSTICRIIRSK